MPTAEYKHCHQQRQVQKETGWSSSVFVIPCVYLSRQDQGFRTATDSGADTASSDLTKNQQGLPYSIFSFDSSFSMFIESSSLLVVHSHFEKEIWTFPQRFDPLTPIKLVGLHPPSMLIQLIFVLYIIKHLDSSSTQYKFTLSYFYNLTVLKWASLYLHISSFHSISVFE